MAASDDVHREAMSVRTDRPEPAPTTDTKEHDPMTPCPRCGAQHGLLRVEHRSRSDGTTYDRFFCASCGYRLEVSGRPNATQRA